MKALFEHNIHPTDYRLEDSLKANEILSKKQLSKNAYQDLMDVKNARKKLEQQQGPLFFVIGLTISLLLTIIVFNWKTYDSSGVVDLGEIEGDFEELLEVPLSAQLPPPPPVQKVEQFVLKEVDDVEIIEEVELSLDVELTEDMSVQQVVFDVPVEEVEEKAEEIFQIVEDVPAFPGGIGEFYKYVAENIVYPEQALRIGVSGKVFVKFVVEKDGTPSQVEVLKGIGAGCDEEAIRVIENSPKWNPGKQRGRAVRVYMTVPINFVFRQS